MAATAIGFVGLVVGFVIPNETADKALGPISFSLHAGPRSTNSQAGRDYLQAGPDVINGDRRGKNDDDSFSKSASARSTATGPARHPQTRRTGHRCYDIAGHSLTSRLCRVPGPRGRRNRGFKEPRTPTPCNTGINILTLRSAPWDSQADLIKKTLNIADSGEKLGKRATAAFALLTQQ